MFSLLCVETTRQFEIAFKMIDADGNDFVDLKEFSKVSPPSVNKVSIMSTHTHTHTHTKDLRCCYLVRRCRRLSPSKGIML